MKETENYEIKSIEEMFHPGRKHSLQLDRERERNQLKFKICNPFLDYHNDISVYIWG